MLSEAGRIIVLFASFPGIRALYSKYVTLFTGIKYNQKNENSAYLFASGNLPSIPKTVTELITYTTFLLKSSNGREMVMCA